AGQMPAAASRRSRWRGPNSELTAPDGRSSPDATPRSLRASPTPSGCRGRAARPRTPASSPPGTGLSGSCDGGARYACTASANHRPRRWRQVHHPTPATYPCRTLPICAPTRVGARLERDAAALPRSAPTEAGSIALAIDGGHVKSVRSYQVRSFEVFVAQVSSDAGKRAVFSSVPAEADLQQQQLRGVLHRLGATPRTPVTILSDGADGPRSLGEAASVGPTHHVLDCFHLSMRIQHVAQAAKGWP